MSMSVSKCASMVGNMTLAELELETLRDFDLVGGASSYHRGHIDYARSALFGVTNATVRLPSRSLPIQNHSLQRHGLQDLHARL